IETMEKLMNSGVIVITSFEEFIKYTLAEIDRINKQEERIMEVLNEIKTALDGVKTSMTDLSTSMQNISNDQQGLLNRIDDLEKALAVGFVVSPADLAALKQQATSLKTQADAAASFAKGVADAVPDVAPEK